MNNQNSVCRLHTGQLTVNPPPTAGGQAFTVHDQNNETPGKACSFARVPRPEGSWELSVTQTGCLQVQSPDGKYVLYRPLDMVMETEIIMQSAAKSETTNQ